MMQEQKMLSEFTVDELKILAYDMTAEAERISQQLQSIHREIAKKQNEAAIAAAKAKRNGMKEPISEMAATP